MKKTTLTVATAPKTSTFQMRINPEIKAQVEGIYAQCGMTLTDAINAFIQQSINVEGMPFLVTANSKQALKSILKRKMPAMKILRNYMHFLISRTSNGENQFYR